MESEQEIYQFHPVRTTTCWSRPFWCCAGQPCMRVENQPSLIVNGNWGESQLLFAVEVKRYGSDKSVMQALIMAHIMRVLETWAPFVWCHGYRKINYWASKNRRISGVDLCGNGVLVAPGPLSFRSGAETSSRASRPLTARLRTGTSALVSAGISLETGI